MYNVTVTEETPNTNYYQDEMCSTTDMVNGIDRAARIDSDFPMLDGQVCTEPEHRRLQ